MRDKKGIKFYGFNELRARLSFDSGFAERPVYVIKGKTTEKWIGVNMIHLVKQTFGLSDGFIKDRLKQLDEDAMNPTDAPEGLERKQLKFTRDEKGNLASPFRSKRKLV